MTQRLAIPDVALPNVALPDVALSFYTSIVLMTQRLAIPSVALPNVALPDVALPFTVTGDPSITARPWLYRVARRRAGG